ncbi:MAG: phosphate ABC transporter permease PstA [Candidatus Nitrohelix vancouverensis]|uniref:Phosphate transport system permease protein PstA n=1 Tax=Candidatus Nitrohelix vancouverensis TaxID=2705534 RepID=A0A7T0C241_9BACT|nr:MAG: phosphate ABC transporter permease PstA [Candidatus Nitrohelix vancouverensis]
MKKSIWKTGDLFIWLTGVCLAFALFLVVALLLNLLVNGVSAFWPSPLHSFALEGGRAELGSVTMKEIIPNHSKTDADRFRTQIKRGNRDLDNSDYIWMDDDKIKSTTLELNAVALERREWGDLYGFLEAYKEDGKVIAEGFENTLSAIKSRLPGMNDLVAELDKVSKDDVGKINYYLEKNRIRLNRLKRDNADAGEIAEVEQAIAELNSEYKGLEKQLAELRSRMKGDVIVKTASGATTSVALEKIIKIHLPNTFGFFDKLGFFIDKFARFLYEDPRESNTEGGVFPAIFGTVMMVLLMSLIAAPLGVLAGFYLREYAKPGLFVSMIRIAVNNLAGVPSIVFGVFGVGFFIYFVGGGIDRFFYEDALPAPTFGTGGILWASLTMALLTVPVVIVSTEEGLASVSRGVREASLALGATKWETSWRVVLPAVMPSILTGLILAMARAAGEVAPLMITGVVKLAPSLPVDGFWPFLHLDRKFMHLGFHIFDVGFQSPNVDAARPMVFATTLLLIMIILCLNLSAIWLRKRLRRKLEISAV